jgi:ankyrin repeat protein
MQWLISHGADTNVRQGRYDMTPLHAAAVGGQLKAARILLQHNADIEAQDIDGWTPLHSASACGHPSLARLLLGYGVNVNARDKHGSTPLHLASHRTSLGGTPEGKIAVARLLLEHGADIAAEDDKGRTAFQVADQDHEEMIKLLSAHIAN